MPSGRINPCAILCVLCDCLFEVALGEMDIDAPPQCLRSCTSTWPSDKSISRVTSLHQSVCCPGWQLCHRHRNICIYSRKCRTRHRWQGRYNCCCSCTTRLAKVCSSSSGRRGIVTRHLVPWRSSSRRRSSANFTWGEAFLSHKWMLASDSVALSHQLLQICWVRPAD